MLLVHDLLRALLMAASMFWQVGWSLVLGFVISAMLQALVSRDRVVRRSGAAGRARWHWRRSRGRRARAARMRRPR